MPVTRKINSGFAFLIIFVSACSSVSNIDPDLNVSETGTPDQNNVLQLLPSETSLAPEGFKGDGYSPDIVATLGSLEQINEYPLYSMNYYGPYGMGWLDESPPTVLGDPKYAHQVDLPNSFACSLFVTLYDPEGLLYGRNFDWQFSPALFLFTDPVDGYASVSMINIAFIRRWGAEVNELTTLPLDEIEDLLRAPYLPIDGMNEHGLVVGMAAVPSSPKPYDESKETIGSLGVIREMLDHARNVDEAVAILDSYNIEWSGGPPIHYLIADRAGEAVLVEFFENKMVVLPDGGKWHLATNFLVSSDAGNPEGHCWRYDTITQRMNQTGATLSIEAAMGLLADVSQGGTQWSVVYDMNRGEVHVVMGRDYDQINTFQITNSGRSQ